MNKDPSSKYQLDEDKICMSNVPCLDDNSLEASSSVLV